MQEGIQEVTKIASLVNDCGKSSRLHNMRKSSNVYTFRGDNSVKIVSVSILENWVCANRKELAHIWNIVFRFRVHPFQNGLRAQNKTKFKII